MTDNVNVLDPSGIIGKSVKIVELASRQDLNGNLGKVVGYNAGRERYTVQLDETSPMASAAAAAAARAGQSAPQGQLVNLKAQNLIVASVTDRMAAKFNTTKTLLWTVYTDPAIREQVRRLYTSFKSSLPAGVKPEYVGLGILLMTALIVRFVGFSKFIMMFSLCSMIPIVCMPDIVNGADAKTCFKNFPRRWRETLVQATGFSNISEKVATIVLGILLLVSFKILFTSSSPAVPLDNASMNTGFMGTENPSGVDSETHRLWEKFMTAEDVYKLGFDDAQAVKNYGASLPMNAASVKLTIPSDLSEGVSSSNEWQFENHQPAEKKSRFGFMTIFAILSLVRTLKELAFTPDNRPDFQLFVTNLRMLEPWKQGMLGFCVYQIFSSVFF